MFTPGVGFCWPKIYRGCESVSVTNRFSLPGLVSVGRNWSRSHICLTDTHPLKIKGKIKEGGANLSGYEYVYNYVNYHIIYYGEMGDLWHGECMRSTECLLVTYITVINMFQADFHVDMYKAQ